MWCDWNWETVNGGGVVLISQEKKTGSLLGVER